MALFVARPRQQHMANEGQSDMHRYKPTLQQSYQGCFDGHRGNEHPLKTGPVMTR